jgi:hypothetical protein
MRAHGVLSEEQLNNPYAPCGAFCRHVFVAASLSNDASGPELLLYDWTCARTLRCAVAPTPSDVHMLRTCLLSSNGRLAVFAYWYHFVPAPSCVIVVVVAVRSIVDKPVELATLRTRSSIGSLGVCV